MDRSKRNPAEKGIITAYVGWLVLAFLAMLLAFATQCSGQTAEELATVKVCGYHGGGQWGYLTGVIFAASDDDHYALTNNHLFHDPVQRVCVWPIGHQFYEAEVVTRSESADVAVLRFQPIKPIQPVPLADKSPSLGTPIKTIGYPLNCTKQNHRIGRLFRPLGKWRQLSFGIQQGESGSPVFSEGKVVGLCWGTSDYAVIAPAEIVASVVDQAASKDVQLTQWRSGCVGGSCSPVQVIQSRPLSRQVVSTQPVGKSCDCDESRIIASVLAVLKREISSGELTEALRGAPGRDGKDGRDGTDADLGALTDEQIEEIAQRVTKEIKTGDLADVLRGKDGQSGYVTVRIVTDTGEELYRLENLKPNTRVDLPLRMRQTD